MTNSKMKFILCVLMCLFSIHSSCYSQLRKIGDKEFNSSNAIKLTFAKSINEAEIFAMSDIEKGIPFLFLHSGIAPIVYTTDEAFENKYEVYYFEQGCIAPKDSLMEAYNHIIFNYLSKKYNKKWKKSIRKDVIGLKSWKIDLTANYTKLIKASISISKENEIILDKTIIDEEKLIVELTKFIKTYSPNYIIQISVDRDARYAFFLKIQENIFQIYVAIKNEKAIEKFNKAYNDLSEREQKEIDNIYPMRIVFR